MGGVRAQSESIGVILLTFVIVLAVGVFSIGALGGLFDGRTASGVLVDVEYEFDGGSLVLTHGGGDSVAAESVEVMVAEPTRARYLLTEFTALDGADAVFDPGERWQRAHSLSGGTVRLIVVHTPSNAVLFDETTDVPAPPRVRWSSASDWDGAVSASSVVHDDVGDHSADAVELGYPARDRGGSGLLTYWTFDGGATDASPNGHDGTVSGARVAETGIAGSRSLAFDGDEDFVEDPDGESYLNGNDAITVSVWVRSNVTGTNRGFLSGQDPDGTDSTLSTRYDSDGWLGGCSDCMKAGLTVDGTEVSYESESGIQTTGWQHLVVTWTSGDRIHVYRNGTEDASTYDETASGTLGGLTTFLVGQGAKDTDSSDGWDGYLDELRIYDRQLSSGEVQALHDVGSSGRLTTGTKTLSETVSPSELRLTDGSTTRPPGTSVEVTVHSDPDGDGTFEETADTISLDGSGEYDVTGLSTASRRYRLEVVLTTSDPTVTPTVERLALTA